MAYKLKYRLHAKFESFLLNKKAMILLAVLAPLVFSISALYLGGHFSGLRFPLHNSKKTDKVVVNNAPVNAVTPEVKPSIFKENLSPLFSEATMLIAPGLNLNIPLQEVGLGADQSLESPKDWKVGGWYKFGSRPGEPGNIIIDGHYDDNYGKPAAFWQLKNLKVDDKVFIEDRYGKRYTYSVTESFLVSINDPNRLKIFETSDDRSTLTLVTCGGIWLPGRATYDKRLVVKAELVVE